LSGESSHAIGFTRLLMQLVATRGHDTNEILARSNLTLAESLPHLQRARRTQLAIYDTKARTRPGQRLSFPLGKERNWTARQASVEPKTATPSVSSPTQLPLAPHPQRVRHAPLKSTTWLHLCSDWLPNPFVLEVISFACHRVRCGLRSGYEITINAPFPHDCQAPCRSRRVYLEKGACGQERGRAFVSLCHG